ncbi:MAG: hypothetical protein MUO53_08305, partial [Maribacter sp.]|nr:hypothetical protein [Maribacter sp.]
MSSRHCLKLNDAALKAERIYRNRSWIQEVRYFKTTWLGDPERIPYSIPGYGGYITLSKWGLVKLFGVCERFEEIGALGPLLL